MRQSKITPDEIEAAEKAADERKSRRGMGFSLMNVRDRGWVRLNTGHIMCWHVKRPLEDGENRQNVPNGHFVIKTDKEDIMFEADEFQKYLRWC
jgi:hypothetical protein